MSGRNSVSPFDIIRELRFPMIVLVTFAHSYSGVSMDYHLLTSDWNTYEFLKLLISQTLVKVAMPVFFIISGYLFFSNVKDWNLDVYREKMIRRAKTLLVPYLIWNLLMALKLKTFSWKIFWVFWCPAGVQTDWFGREQLMTAPANMPLWFLRDLIIVSLFTPIIYIAVRKFGFWLMGVLTITYLSGVFAFVPGLSAYAVYFFTFGAFVSIRKYNVVKSLKRIELPAYLLSLLLAVVMLVTFRTSCFSSVMLVFRLTGAVSVFCLASRLMSITDKRQPRLVSDSNYFIYLAHYVFFFSVIDEVFFSLFGQSEMSLSIHYFLSPLLKVALLIFVYAIYSIVKRLIMAYSKEG